MPTHSHLPRRGLAAASAIGLQVAASMAWADPVVDQTVDGAGNSGQIFVDIEREFAQSFTVGVGGVLTRIDVEVRGFSTNTGPLLYDVLPLEMDGSPVEDPEQALATGTVPLDAIPVSPDPWELVAIEHLAIQVAPGDRLAVVLRVPAESTDVASWLVAADPYDGGSGFCRGVCAAEWTAGIGGDYKIRTWVDPDLELDQVSDTLDPSSGQVFVDAFIPETAQTFRVGRDGTLARFDVKVRVGVGAEDIQWYLLPLEPDGSPVEDLGLARASGSIPAAGIPTSPELWDWVTVEGFAVPVVQDEGLALALALPPETASVLSWLVGSNYPDGARFCRRPGSEAPCPEMWEAVVADLRFRTFLLAAPEPGAGTLGVAALAALVGLDRRRARWRRRAERTSRDRASSRAIAPGRGS